MISAYDAKAKTASIICQASENTKKKKENTVPALLVVLTKQINSENLWLIVLFNEGVGLAQSTH